MFFVSEKINVFLSSRKCHILSLFIIFVINSIPYFYRFSYEGNIYASDDFVKVITDLIIPSLIATITTVIVVNNLKKCHILGVSFFSILWLINSYILITFGHYDYSVIASIIDSPAEESIDYLKHIHIPLQLFFVILFFYLLYKYRYINNKKFNISSLLALFILFVPLTVDSFNILKHQGELMGECSVKRECSNGLNLKGLIRTALRKDNNIQLLLTIKNVYSLKKFENEEIIPAWTNIKSSKNSKQYNYIIIIGESSPRKSFSYYQGEKLDKFIGWEFISDAISPATNTRESVPRILSKNKYYKINKNLNIIDLANEAGLNTYWFSNQGIIGEHDTFITNIAKRSQHVIFHNQGDSATAVGSDDQLLVDLKKTVADHKTNKLIFLHTMGSHPTFCRRSQHYELHIKNYDPNDERSCFKDNIYNVELYINKVNSIMKSTTKNYKIIYFSDHGLTDVDYSPYKVHGVGKLFSKDAINIPLIFIDSTNKHKGVLINKKYYIRDFVNTFSSWTGITANEIEEDLSIYNKDIKQEAYTYQGSSLVRL